MTPTGRIVPPEQRCIAEECQSMRRSDVVPYCGFHSRVEATRKAQIAYAAKKKAWRERDAAAAAAAGHQIAQAVADGAECPHHPGEGLLDCRGCEAIAEDRIQGGDIDE